MTRRLVVSRDYAQFADWCHRQGINPHSPSVVWVKDRATMRGYGRGGVVVVVLDLPGWWDTRDTAYLRHLAAHVTYPGEDPPA